VDLLLTFAVADISGFLLMNPYWLLHAFVKTPNISHATTTGLESAGEKQLNPKVPELIENLTPKLVKRYAQRMIIENNIEDGIDFFHMDALSSAVAMKVNLGLQITLMASSLYRLFSSGIGNGHEKAKSRHIFRDSIDGTAMIMITEKEVIVRFQKRAHNPFLIAPDFDKIDVPIPWLGRKRIQFMFG